MNRNKVLLGLTLLVGLATRLYHVTAISLWHDEAFSALLVNYSWKEMIYRIGLDVHPPFYYILLRLWTDVLGHSLLSLRGFSVFFGVATILAVYLLIKEAFSNEKLALAGAALIAVNPFQIQYVTEARMYTLGTFLIAMAAYLLVKGFKALKDESKTSSLSKWLIWILYGIFMGAAMLTHYYLFFSVFALGLFGLIYLYKNYKFQFAKWKYFLSGNILALLLFVPWLKIFMFQFRQVQENYWIPKIGSWSVPQTNWTMLISSESDPNKSLTKVLLVLAALFTIYLLYRIIRKVENGYKWLIVAGLAIPFAGALLLSLKQSIYLDRYFLFAAMFFTIALAIFIFSIPNKILRTILFLIIAIIYVSNWASYWSKLHVQDKPGMAAAAEYLNNNVEKNDKLYIGSSFEFFNFKYYNQTGHTPLLYTPGIGKVTDLPHFSGTALLTDDDLIHNFSTGANKGDNVWILWTTGFGGTKPTVPANWHQINELAWQDVRPWVGTQVIVDEYHVQ